MQRRVPQPLGGDRVCVPTHEVGKMIGVHGAKLGDRTTGWRCLCALALVSLSASCRDVDPNNGNCNATTGSDRYAGYTDAYADTNASAAHGNAIWYRAGTTNGDSDCSARSPNLSAAKSDTYR